MTAITALPTELAAMREVVEKLAQIERAAGKPGEHEAAARIVERLRAAGERADAPLRRGMRSRNSTDAVLMSRAGYKTACFSSIDRHQALSNYHQMSDTPENLIYETVMHAVTVAESVTREVAR